MNVVIGNKVSLQNEIKYAGNNGNEIVSVIIPCYKQAGFLKEAINSVIKQTYNNFEIIVIDDGSPDNVSEIVGQCPGVKLLWQPNQGAAVARNFGIESSIGSYLIFLDADDRLLPNALEAGINFLKNNPKCAYVTGLIQLIDSKGNLKDIPSQPIIEKDHFKTLLKSNYIWTPGVVMYRKSTFHKHNGFDKAAGGSADYELNIRIASTEQIGSHGQIILEYRQHEDNMSSNLAYMLKSGISVRRNVFEYIKHDPEFVKAWKAGIKIVQDDIGIRFIRQIMNKNVNKKQKMEIFKDIWYVVKYYPKGVIYLIIEKFKHIIVKR